MDQSQPKPRARSYSLPDINIRRPLRTATKSSSASLLRLRPFDVSKIDEIRLPKTKLKNKLVIWVRYIPFEFGLLPVPPCSKLAISILQKCMRYIKSRELTPTLSFARWYRLCTQKITLDWDMGWILIRHFDLLRRLIENEDQEPFPGYWDEKCSKLKEHKKDNENEFYVHTLQFLLFLYMQHTLRIFDDINSSKIEYVTPRNFNVPSAFIQAKSNPTIVKVSEEEIQFELVKDNIGTIVEFLEIDSKFPDRISAETLDALNFILCATSLPEASDKPFPSIAKAFETSEPNEIDDLGSVNKIRFLNWIKEHLEVYPWGPSGCLKVNLELVIGICQPLNNPTAFNENKILWNKQKPPNSWYIFSNANAQLFNLKNLPQFTNIKIHRCNKSFFYLPSVTTFVVLDKVVNCTIYLGPVAKVCRVTKCQGIKFIGIVRQLMICDTITSEFGIFTPLQPVLGTRNKDLVFGPYNSTYPRLAHDLVAGKFNTTIMTIFNNWNSVHEIGSDGYLAVSTQNWKEISPSSYYNFVFPLPPVEIPLKLGIYSQAEAKKDLTPSPAPVLICESKYTKAAKEKDSTLEYWQAKEKEAELTEEQSKQFETIMFTRFLLWLKESGQEDELVGLKSYYESLQANTKKPIELEPRVLTSSTAPSSLKEVLDFLPFIFEEQNDEGEDVHGGEGDVPGAGVGIGAVGEDGDSDRFDPFEQVFTEPPAQFR